MAGFVQDRVQWRIGTRVQTVPLQAGFIIAPVTAGDRRVIGAANQRQVKGFQQLVELDPIGIGEP